MASTELDLMIEKVKSKSNKTKWLLGIGAALLLTPLVWALAYAVLGVAALGASIALAATVGIVVVNGLPVLLMKAQNAKINAIIAEATKNPIPTLWAVHEADKKELDEMSDAIIEYGTEINNIRSKKSQLIKDLTAEDLETFEADIRAMEMDRDLQEQDLADATKAHQMQEVQIKRASAIWDLNMAVNKANAKNPNRAADTLAKIKKETALDSVTNSMSKSKAQLRARIQQRMNASDVGTGHRPALENNASTPLITEVVDARVKVAK